MDQPPASIEIKQLEDDDTVSLDQDDGPAQWVQERTFALDLLEGSDEVTVNDAHREVISNSDQLLRETLSSLPDRIAEFAPEPVPPISLAAANSGKTLHDGPVVAASAVAYGLVKSGVLKEKRPPDFNYCYYTSFEHNESTLVFVSLRWDLTDQEKQLPANRGKSKVIRQIAAVEGGWQTSNPYVPKCETAWTTWTQRRATGKTLGKTVWASWTAADLPGPWVLYVAIKDSLAAPQSIQGFAGPERPCIRP